MSSRNKFFAKKVGEGGLNLDYVIVNMTAESESKEVKLVNKNMI